MSGLNDDERENLDEALWAGRIFDDVPAAVERIVTDHSNAARAEIVRLREVLEGFATHGIRTDCNPTLLNGEASTAWWTTYLRSADERVRKTAREALIERSGQP